MKLPSGVLNLHFCLWFVCNLITAEHVAGFPCESTKKWD